MSSKLNSPINIEIPADQLSDFFSQAVLAALDSQQKERLIEGALTYLLTKPPKQKYGDYPQKSPLEKAFEKAIDALAFKLASQYIEDNPRLVSAIKDYVDRLERLEYESKIRVLRAFSDALISEIIDSKLDD